VSEAAPILKVATDPAWYAVAAGRWPELLIDHATCEKKAASTALSLMFAYADDTVLGRRLSKLAREELRHYEQVLARMESLGVAYERRAPSRYAQGLRRACSVGDPARKLDLLLLGALIEARSAERFAGLVGCLPAPLAEFYASLHAAEVRHQGLYLELAATEAARSGGDVSGRLAELSLVEADLISSPDEGFHFHSGTPAGFGTVIAAAAAGRD
jgi:tRNA 2-(methylsulfanyl)-N6-isopentenyladenosine37 hydroxylase